MPFLKGHPVYAGAEKGWLKKGHKLNVGYKHTKEARENMRLANLGKHDGVKNNFYGKTHTKEVRERISLARKGKSSWNKGLTMETDSRILRPKNGFKKGQVAVNKGKHLPGISGENSHWWKGGVTPKNHKIRWSLEMRLWRAAVFERDVYTCKKCGAKGVYLNAHHIKPFAKFPKLRFDVDNGITLCKLCHMKEHGWEVSKETINSSSVKINGESN